MMHVLQAEATEILASHGLQSDGRRIGTCPEEDLQPEQAALGTLRNSDGGMTNASGYSGGLQVSIIVHHCNA